MWGKLMRREIPENGAEISLDDAFCGNDRANRAATRGGKDFFGVLSVMRQVWSSRYNDQ